MVSVVLWGIVAGGRSAAAADCPEPYSVDAMLEDLVSVETFLRNNDDENAGKASANLQNGFGCMTEVLPRMIAGRAIRAVGAGLVVSGDPDGGGAWLRTAAEIEQSFAYGLEDLSETSPVRDVYATAQLAAGGEEAPVAGATLAAGAAYLDGRKLLEPKARGDRWHVFQFDGGSGVKSWVIDGNAFPDEVLVLAAPVAAGKAKKVKDPPVTAPKPVPVPVAAAPKPVVDAAPSPKPARPLQSKVAGSTVVIERDRPWEKTPLMIGGGIVVAGAGAVYYASFATRQKFEDATSPDPLKSLQGQTNRLYIASLAVLAVGAGTLTWGVILDGDGAPLPALRVRF
ncbi:MAG: hypothetical protein ABMB14_03535 [Myxococcota bacterium]